MDQLSAKKAILDKLFPGTLVETKDVESKYPLRVLKNGSLVTRFAPSPTGFMHIGGLYASLISERLAHQSGGIFFLRIEDTDKKREVAGASELVVESLTNYGIKIDEGQTPSGKEVGAYGPYRQSDRADIYKAYIKFWVESGLAYPCFCSGEELETMNKEQETEKARFGYYGKWAKCRDKSNENILETLEKGTPFVIRFKSNGSFDRKIKFTDLLKGDRELPENDQDIVIMKSDGLPTYHFAHLIDDHFMYTTHVIRGDEWFPSVPLHLQLFQSMGWAAPQYGHILPIQKMDGQSKRKLSKRKDSEANMAYYSEAGYPKDAVIEYLLNLANSNFEDWRKLNPRKDNHEFILTVDKLAHSNGALFDFNKLNDISREVVARFKAEYIFSEGLSWAKKYDKPLADLMEKNLEYTISILNIERDSDKARKDIAKWSDLRGEIGYFFEEVFTLNADTALSLLSGISLDDIRSITKSFIETYDENDSKEAWLTKMKSIAVKHGYAEDAKTFKAEPSKYKGHLGDVAKVFRVLLAGKTNTPDLYSVMKAMNRARVIKRLSIL